MRQLREIPMSSIAERAVVACCIWLPSVIPFIFEICSVTDFVDAEMKIFMRAIYDLWKSDVAVDKITVEQKILDCNECTDGLLDVWYKTISSDTINVLPSTTNAEYYAGIVKEKSIERDLVRAIEQLSEDIYDKTLDVKEKKELFDQAVLGLSLENEIKDQNIAAIAKRIWESILAEEDEGQMFIPTGYERIDEQIGGFGPGEFAVVAARPSNGKSTMLVEMAMSISLNNPVLILSMEMNQESLALRVLAQLTRIPILKLKSGDLTEEQKERCFEAVKLIGRYKIYIDDSPMLSPAALSSKIMKAKAVYKIGCVMVDYIQLMHIPKWRSDNRVTEMTRISNELRATAKRARIPLIAASQMSRSIEGRTDGEPRLSDLRESGAIEQDADYVFFLYPYKEDMPGKGYEQWTPGPNDPRQHCCKIAKCRQGPRDIKINFHWTPAFFTFKDNANKVDEEIPI